MRDDWFVAPYERILLRAPHHPVALLPSLGLALAALIAAAAVGVLASPEEGSTALDVVAGAGAVAACAKAAVNVLRWTNQAVVITSARLVRLSGILGRRVEALPLDRIDELAVRTSAAGRALDFGDITITHGARRSSTHIRAVREPVRFYKVLAAAQTASAALLPLGHPEYAPPAAFSPSLDDLQTTELPPVIVH